MALYNLKEYARSARHFETALSDEAVRTDLKPGTLYPAACSAALAAGVLEGKEADYWRSRALEWLPREAATDKHRRGGRGVEKGTGYIRTQPAKWQEMIQDSWNASLTTA